MKSTMLIALVLVACAYAASAGELPLPQKVHYDLVDAAKLFQDFKKQHHKIYSSAAEHLHRFHIFLESLRKINELNAKSRHAVFGLNHLADYTEDELYGLKPLNESEIVRVDPTLEAAEAPSSFDWREKNVLSPVKSQGQCGSCYVFSAIANIESQYALKNHQCLALSEQQCMDCLPGTGCNGGFPHTVMNNLAQQRRKCAQASEYRPYAAKPGQCDANARGIVSVQGGKVLAVHDEDTLMQALVQIGPLAVTMSAADLQVYHVGILEPHYCIPQQQDHAVLLVGYGTDNSGIPYWIIRNSWGPQWGEQGYARLRRGINACGMGTYYAASSLVA